MAGMNGYEACCGNCKFWKRIDVGRAEGHCRRNPPVLLVMLRPHPSNLNQMVQVADTFWPMVGDTGLCGEHPKMRDMAVAAGIDFSKMARLDEEADPA